MRRSLYSSITAHSLNDCSMDKLFDLMVMGFKMQLAVSTDPADILTTGIRRLDTLRSVLRGPSGNSDTQEDQDPMILLDQFCSRLKARFRSMSAGAWLAVRQVMLRVFEDRMVKVWETTAICASW
jgi:Organic solute transport protein 1